MNQTDQEEILMLMLKGVRYFEDDEFYYFHHYISDELVNIDKAIEILSDYDDQFTLVPISLLLKTGLYLYWRDGDVSKYINSPHSYQERMRKEKYYVWICKKFKKSVDTL